MKSLSQRRYERASLSWDAAKSSTDQAVRENAQARQYAYDWTNTLQDNVQVRVQKNVVAIRHFSGEWMFVSMNESPQGFDYAVALASPCDATSEFVEKLLLDSGRLSEDHMLDSLDRFLMVHSDG